MDNQSDNFFLAIVIPFYKIDFFEQTLKSIKDQRDRRFVVYIGNDASPSDPLPLIEQYLGDITYNYFLYTTNVGGTDLASQWERILNNVKEKWFQILGDDDVIESTFVEEFYKHLDKVNNLNINVIRCDYYRIDERNNPLVFFHENYITTSSQSFMMRKLNWEVGSSLSENIFRLESYKRHGFEKFPLAWHSDDYALLRISDFGLLYHITTTCVYVRVSSVSITGSDHFLKEKQKACLLFFEKLLSDSIHIDDKAFLQQLKYSYLFQCRLCRQLPNSSMILLYLIPFKLNLFLSYMKTYFLTFYSWGKSFSSYLI